MISKSLLENVQLISTVALLLIVFVGIPLYYIITKKWDELRKYALKLFTVAEDTIRGDKLGQQRFKYVLGTIYSTVVPRMLQRLITLNMVEEKLQKWYDEVVKLIEYIPPTPPITGANEPVKSDTSAAAQPGVQLDKGESSVDYKAEQ
jgi:hypothetical protein